MIRVAVIGCGSIGRRHVRNLAASGRATIVAYDPSPDARARIEAEAGVPTAHTIDAIWSQSPDAVVVASPPHAHIEAARAAVERGCHVLIEKPLAHSVDGLEDLISSAERAGIVSLVGCNMRFHPGPACVKRLLTGGRIGRILFARVFGGSYLPDWHPDEDYRRSYSARPEMGGGCILDAIHEIDLACWYAGAPRTVAAMGSRIGDIEIGDVEDVASLIVRHTSGAHSEIHLDYLQRVAIRGCVIAGVEGTIAWEWSVPEVRIFDASTRGWTVESLPAEWSLNDMYVDEMRHFLDCVEANAPSCNPIAEAAIITRLALAARASSLRRAFIDV